MAHRQLNFILVDVHDKDICDLEDTEKDEEDRKKTKNHPLFLSEPGHIAV